MENLVLFYLIFGAIVACRAFSFAIIQWDLYNHRGASWLKRVVKEQKVSDIMVAFYHMSVTMLGIWIATIGILKGAFPLYATNIVMVTGLLIVFLMFAVYWIMYFVLHKKYNLKMFYNNMVSYRKKQEVVTKDNDFEVNFLKTYRRAKKHIYYSIIWVILLFIFTIVSILCI